MGPRVGEEGLGGLQVEISGGRFTPGLTFGDGTELSIAILL